jgi:hypothetical protein
MHVISEGYYVMFTISIMWCSLSAFLWNEQSCGGVQFMKLLPLAAV